MCVRPGCLLTSSHNADSIEAKLHLGSNWNLQFQFTGQVSEAGLKGQRPSPRPICVLFSFFAWFNRDVLTFRTNVDICRKEHGSVTQGVLGMYILYICTCTSHSWWNLVRRLLRGEAGILIGVVLVSGVFLMAG